MASHFEHARSLLDEYDLAHVLDELDVDRTNYRRQIAAEIVDRLRRQQRATESVRGLDTAASLIAHWFDLHELKAGS